jgi:hypothetical protein
MKTILVWAVALTVIAVAVVQGRKTESNLGANAGSADAGPAPMTAAFRDGMYLAKLAVQEGRAPHVSPARWAAEPDRQAFTAGYERGYAAKVAGSAKVEAIDGALRDGLYLGAIDARQGKERHIASGRWATGTDRTSFVYGYIRGYQGVSSARPPRGSGVELATR